MMLKALRQSRVVFAALNTPSTAQTEFSPQNKSLIVADGETALAHIARMNGTHLF